MVIISVGLMFNFSSATHKKALENQGPKKWWSCRESNPGPNIFAISFLHVYCCITCREKAGATQTNFNLRWMVLSNGHIIPLQHPVFFLSRRKNLATDQPVQRPEWLLVYRLSSHGILSIAIWSFRIQIEMLITQRITCLHLQRTMLSKPVSPGRK